MARSAHCSKADPARPVLLATRLPRPKTADVKPPVLECFFVFSIFGAQLGPPGLLEGALLEGALLDGPSQTTRGEPNNRPTPACRNRHFSMREGGWTKWPVGSVRSGSGRNDSFDFSLALPTTRASCQTVPGTMSWPPFRRSHESLKSSGIMYQHGPGDRQTSQGIVLNSV